MLDRDEQPHRARSRADGIDGPRPRGPARAHALQRRRPVAGGGGAGGHQPIGRLIPDLAFDAIEVVNNAGVFSRLYDAWAALRNVEWMLPVTAGSDAHDVWYLVSACTTFPGRDAAALRGALEAGR